MKESRNEKLSEHLLHIDEELLISAYDVDDAEKLAEYAKKNSRRRMVTSPLIRVAAIAAAFALLLGSSVFFARRLLFDPIGGSAPPDSSYPPDNEFCFDDVPAPIRSLDMLNYYAAMLTLSGRWGRSSAQPIVVSDAATTLVPLSSASDGATTFVPLSGLDDDTVTYEIDPDEVFTISSVVFFRVHVSDSRSFLASKVGTGLVDVVITENNLEPMITFKNGDRYYTCLENGRSEDSVDFSTHKYIQGFKIVKSGEWECCRFYVKFDGNNTDAASWSVKSLTVTPVDGESLYTGGTLYAKGETKTHRGTVFFTVRDLDAYFGNSTEPVVPVPEEKTREYANELNSFHLSSDGSFVFSGIFSDGYRLGRYEENESEITFVFLLGGVEVETTVCVKTADGGFLYRNTKFTPKEANP